MKTAATVQGQYRMRTFKEGRATKDTGYFDNLITDLGLDMLGGHLGGAWHNYLHLGVGTQPPSASDVSLEKPRYNKLNSAQLTQYIEGAFKRLVGSKVWLFSLGEFSGRVTEVGVGNSAAGNLFSRAVPTSLTGSAGTFEVFEDEVLEVEYRILFQQPEDVTVVTTEGKSVLIRPAFNNTLSSSSGWGWDASYVMSYRWLTVHTGNISTISSGPVGTSLVSYAGTQSAYVLGSYKRRATFTFPGQTSIGTITSLSWQYGPSCWQCLLPEPLVQLGDEAFICTVEISWGRA